MVVPRETPLPVVRPPPGARLRLLLGGAALRGIWLDTRRCSSAVSWKM